MNSNAVLRLMVDALIDAGAWNSAEEGRAYVRTKLAEYDAAGRLRAEPANCPFTQPGGRAALDGLAGAFLQASEHFELLAETPPQVTIRPPAPVRPGALRRSAQADGSCQG